MCNIDTDKPGSQTAFLAFWIVVLANIQIFMFVKQSYSLSVQEETTHAIKNLG